MRAWICSKVQFRTFSMTNNLASMTLDYPIYLAIKILVTSFFIFFFFVKNNYNRYLQVMNQYLLFLFGSVFKKIIIKKKVITH